MGARPVGTNSSVSGRLGTMRSYFSLIPSKIYSITAENLIPPHMDTPITGG